VGPRAIAGLPLRKDGAGRFNTYSAGSQPKGVVNPFVLKVLESYDYPTEGSRSRLLSVFVPYTVRMEPS